MLIEDLCELVAGRQLDLLGLEQVIGQALGAGTEHEQQAEGGQ